MNYGYEPTDRDEELADEIEEYLVTLEPDARGHQPYVEINQYYRGVRVRRLTHYTEKQLDKIVSELDKIHARYI